MEDYVIKEAQNRGYEIQNVHDGLCDVLDRENGMLWRDAPLEDVERYTMETLDGTAVYPCLLMKDLAFDRYDVIGNLWYQEKPVLMMQSKKGGMTPYCVQYGGNGKYFRDFESMMAYAFIRFAGKELTQKQRDMLEGMCRDHIKGGTPIRWDDWERMKP